MKRRIKMWMLLVLMVLVGLGVPLGSIRAEAKKKTINVYATKGPDSLYAVKSGKYIYFTGSAMDIMRYDTKSGKVSTLVKLKGSGACLVKKGKHLYYSSDGFKGDKYNEKAAGIYRCSLSGKNVTKIGKASEFALKGKKIYYENYNEKSNKFSIKSMSLSGKNVKKESKVKFKYVTHGTISNSYGKLSVSGLNYDKEGPYSVTLTFKNKKSGNSSTVFSGNVDGISYIMAGNYIVYNYSNLKSGHAYSHVYVQKIDGTKKKEIHSGKVY